MYLRTYVCIFFIKEVVVLIKVFAPLRENEHSDLQYEHPGFFDTEVNRTGNPSTNIWNIVRFSSTYVSDLTAPISTRYINKSLFTDDRTRKITLVAKSIPSKCLKFTSRF